MEIINTNALISINATFIAQLVFFLIFVFILKKILIIPIDGVLNKRREYLNSIQNEIDGTMGRFSYIKEENKKKRTRIIKESYSISDKIGDDGENKAGSIYMDAKKKVAVFQKEFDEEVKKRINILKTDLYEDVDKISILIVNKVFDRS